jgi:hypothetical protein
VTVDTDALGQAIAAAGLIPDEIPALRELLEGEKALNKTLLRKVETLVCQNIRMHAALASWKGRVTADAIQRGGYEDGR